MNTISRRSFIHRAMLASGSILLSSCAPKPLNFLPSLNVDDGDSPINRYLGDKAERAFFGPNPSRAHQFFLFGTQPPVPETWTLHQGPVVIGGGMSGLGAAFLLRDKNPLVLEATAHFGGNSQAQQWNQIPYSIGAAYIVKPEEGGEIHQFLEQLGLLSKMSPSPSEDQFYMQGAIHKGLWHGGKRVYGSKASQVDKLYKHLLSILNDEEGTPYPDMPTDDTELRSYLNKLDKLSFAEYLEKFLHGPVPEPLGTALEQYCWSSFGGSAKELSAASALNFYASELDDICVFDAGNARITQTLFERLVEHNGRDSLRSESIVTSVEATDSGVKISVIDPEGKAYGIIAPVAIMCCQKFVAKKIIKNLPQDQLGAFSRLRYRSYLTANVLIKGPQALHFYDLYLLKQEKGKALAPSTPMESLGATDVIIANWNTHHSGDIVLNLYRALPYDGARAELYAPTAYERARAVFEKQVASELLPLFNIPQDRVVDMRVTRWGHALPLAEKGLIAEGFPELLTRPINKQIFFCNQDNWALPAFETSSTEAIRIAKEVRTLLT